MPDLWHVPPGAGSGALGRSRFTSNHVPGVYWEHRFGNRVVLTFDDGPNASTPEVLEALRQAGVRGAVFFVNGIHAQRRPGLLRLIASHGHLVGNHGWEHVSLDRKRADQLDADIGKTQRTIEEILARRVPRLFRPPYGVVTDAVIRYLATHHYRLIMWNADGKDWKHAGAPDRIVGELFAGSSNSVLSGGGTVLLHDKPDVVAALPDLIARIRANGHELVEFSNLFPL